jgi:eukaryotic-like serine/threonine-protein kinase
MNEESLFFAALEKPTLSQRRAFLDEACAGDVGLRRRVERLIEAHQKTPGILDQAGRAPDWTAPDVGLAAGASFDGERSGTVIGGRYSLLEEIGIGGMGTVWRAEQTQPMRRMVALKLIKAGMDSKSVLSRFEAERQALALMDHPNIARVLDGGTTDRGRPYFVMEFVEGVPLMRYCDEARLTIAQRLELFVPVCQAVQHAHTKGVIHRDLKPSNVLVSLYDGRPVPKVIDFGLAKAMQQPLTERTLNTAHGELLGTPLYMSPEQAELNNTDVDARADVYALGVVLYELLTGTTPLERLRFRHAAVHELLKLIKEEDPPLPSARLSNSEALPSLAALRGLEPVRLKRLVRGELDWIVMKCLEKDRRRRYETASGLAGDVVHYLADEPVDACPVSVVYRMRKFVKRHKRTALAGSFVVLALVVGIIGTTWGMLRADRAWEAEAARANGERTANAQAQKRLKQVENASEILSSIFKDLDPNAEQKEGRPLRVILGERLDRAAADLEGDAVGDPLVVAGLQVRLGRTYLALGHAAKAKTLFNKALAHRRTALGPEHPETLEVMFQNAAALHHLGELKEAAALYEQVREAQLRTLGPTDRQTLTTGNHLAMAQWKAGNWLNSRALLEQVRDALVEHYGPDDPQTIDTLDDLAAVYSSTGKADEAIILAQRVRESRVKTLGAGHHLSINALQNLAAVYSGAGKMRLARDLLEQARDGIVPILGPEHPSSLNILDSLARIYRAFGRTPEAVALAEQVRDARTLHLGASHPDTIYTIDNLGKAYEAANEPEKALAMFRRAAAGLEKLDFAHAAARLIVYNICEALEQRNQSDQANLWRRKWMDATRRRDGPDSIQYANVLLHAGEDLLEHRPAEAEPILRESVAILHKKQPNEPTIFHAQSTLGAALADQGKYAEAEPELLKGYEGFLACAEQLSPLYANHRIAEAGERIVGLYEAWGQRAKAAEWRAKLNGRGETKSKPH